MPRIRSRLWLISLVPLFASMHCLADSTTAVSRHVTNASTPYSSPISSITSATGKCILDSNSGLLWELKSRDVGLQYNKNTYSWFREEETNTGHSNGGICTGSRCDTSAYVAAINRLKLCGRTNWRLPDREQLRSIVNYSTTYPGPTINHLLFPNTLSQFYWSASPSALEPDSVWGIGFAFGYDYTYGKSHAAPVRLVSDSK